MTSKAERRKRKRGRPRKEDAVRTESGQISRAANPEPADKVAKEARIRLFGLSAKDASDQKAATVIGRWSLIGQAGGGISSDQYDNIVRFLQCRERYMSSISAPDSLRSKGGGRMPSIDEDMDAEAKERVRRQYDTARAAIQNAQNEHRTLNLWGALDHVVFRDMDFAHMVGDIRIIGNALHRHYSGEDKRRAA